MKKVIQIIVISLFTCFSFYYTERIVEFSKMQDPIMGRISSLELGDEPVNGVLTRSTMLVGRSGTSVDVNKSYEQMKRVNEYNENLLEFISVKPSILKKDNLDKYIVGVNTDDRDISLVFSFDSLDRFFDVVNILNNNDVSATFFMDGKLIFDNYDKISGISDKISFGLYGYNSNYNEYSIKYVKGLISEGLSYSNYCLYINSSFFSSCISSGINTIKPYFVRSNIFDFFVNSKENGMIYEIGVSDNNIKDLNSVIMYLKQKGYNIVSIDDLLKE